MSQDREPFKGRYFGIVNVESDDGDPLVLFRRVEDARKELRRRKNLPPYEDDHATDHHQVFPMDIAGAWWNSYDPDPRADSPLDVEEIVAIHQG